MKNRSYLDRDRSDSVVLDGGNVMYEEHGTTRALEFFPAGAASLASSIISEAKGCTAPQSSYLVGDAYLVDSNTRTCLWWLRVDIDEEQKEILEISEKLSKIPGRAWFRYKGDVVARTVIDLLNTHVPGAYRVVGPNVYVEGYPTEFDALVVERDSSPVPRTPAYEEDHVKVLIEIKKHGFYYRKIKGKYRIGEYFQSFRDTGKPFLYLTVRESAFFISATQKILGSDCFFLGVSRGKPIEGEWRRFVERVGDLLR